MDGVVQKTSVTSKKRKRNLENYAYDFIRNPPGHITEKGQLVVKHPGAKNPWSCSQCQEQLATNKLFEKHLSQRHQIKKFVYMCMCGYGSESAKSTGVHLRYCDGAIPEEHLRQRKCDICHFSTDDANGLLVHRSVAHKEQYNKELVAKEKGYKWTKPELGYLAEMILELKRTKIRNVNRAAGSRLGRTEQAFQKIRQKAEYRQTERELKEKRGEVDGNKERSHTTEEELSNMREREQTTNNTRIIELQEGTHNRNSETPSSVYKRIPRDVATPSLNTIRRQLAAVSPTPFNEDQRISQLLLNENSSLTIVNTPSVQPSPRERRILLETPLDRSRQRSSSLPLITTITRKTPITNPRAHITNLPINHRVVETPTSRPVGSRMETIRSLPNRNRSVMSDIQGRPDYKKAAYLDCRSYAATLCSENILDKTVKEYLEGNTGWNKVTEVIASEERASQETQNKERTLDEELQGELKYAECSHIPVYPKSL